MSSWVIEPRDTLVVRDGRPLQDGAVAMCSVDFPWPSTMAGLVRTRIGTDGGRGAFNLTPEEARAIAVSGPLLARLCPREELLVPAPRDCLWQRTECNASLCRYRLVPQEALAPGEQTDLETDPRYQTLWLVGPLERPPPGKAEAGPAFWRWVELETWLCCPTAVLELREPWGRAGLLHEQRTHVALTPDTGTVVKGALFSTDGLRWAYRHQTGPEERLALWLLCEDTRLRPGPVVCGGERRPAFLRAGGPARPAVPKELKPGPRLRLLLLTPALFRAGFLPAPATLRGARLVACCVPRPLPLSGWDLVVNGPKRTRWAVPAGSVYWVELPKEIDPQEWTRHMWFTCLSDEEQDRRDGFGLCVVGVA